MAVADPETFDSIAGVAAWLEATPASLALQQHSFTIPLLQSLHILAIAFVFSASLLLGLRSFGRLGAQWPLARWNAGLSRRLWLGLALAAASGALLVLAEPQRELLSPVFQLKLLLLLPTVVLAAALARRLAAEGPQPSAASAATRAAAAALVLLWLLIIVAGRWIAYA